MRKPKVKIKMSLIYTLFICVFISFDVFSMVGTKRKTPEKEELTLASVTQQPLILKKRKVSPLPVKTLREISKQKFIQIAPNVVDLPKVLASTKGSIDEEIKKDLRGKLSFGDNRLHRAESEQEVENLLFAGVNPNDKNQNGQTALSSLIERGNLDAAYHLAALDDLVLSYMLRFGKLRDLQENNSECERASQPLSREKALGKKITQEIATQVEGSQGQKNLIIIKNFLKSTGYKPLDINSSDDYGLTPLQKAIKRQEEELAKIIIELMLKTKVFKKRLKRLNLLSPQTSLKKIGLSNHLNGQKPGWEPLFLATRYMPQLIDELVELGARVNEVNGEGFTPLMVATEFNPSAIPTLINAGADVNAAVNFKNYKGITALMFAVMFKYSPEAVKILLQEKADINKEDGFKRTALTYAAESETQLGILKLLIDAGANVNHVTSKGKTALRQAVMYNPDAIEILVNAGADFNGIGGSAPLFTVVREDIFKNDTLKSLRKLLALGADANIENEEGKTPLDIAIENVLESLKTKMYFNDFSFEDKLEVVKELLSHGAKISPRSFYNAQKASPILTDLLAPYFVIAQKKEI